MRKGDLLILLTVVGVTASLWHSRILANGTARFLPTPTPTAARGEITLAGLSLGMTRTEIEKRLGTAHNSNGPTLRYKSDGAERCKRFWVSPTNFSRARLTASATSGTNRTRSSCSNLAVTTE